MKKMLIVSNNKYSYTDSMENKNITKKAGEKIFADWKSKGLQIHRKYGMNNKTCWIWVEE